ncbi:hypothetical protein ARMGADRAFT_868926, partial [Armillaria gallica]
VNGKIVTHQLKDTLYALNTVNNLISISRLDDTGMEASFKNGIAQFFCKDRKILAEGKKTHHLYLMNAQACYTIHEKINIADVESANTWDAWH